MKVRRIAATEETKKLRVAAYCRVSTKHDEQEDSLEVQQSTYENYILKNPEWEYVGLYTDARSGLSAEKRDGFLRLIDDAMAGKIDLILCKSVSRFSRNIVECQRYTEMLRGKNVTVVFEKEHIRTDVPTSNLIFSLMSAIAQDESRSISENMTTANRPRVEAGVYTPHKNQMLGYKVEKGKMVPNEDAWIILYIFNRYAEGAGIMEICRELEEKRAQRKYSKSTFSPSAIQRILGNESYVGDKKLQKEAPRNFLTKKPDPSVPYASNYLFNDHEGIVSREVWRKVAERMEKEGEQRKVGMRLQGNSHALYGKIICGNCGQPYMRRTFRKRGVDEHYFVWCCKGKTYKNGCKNPNIREDKLMEALREKSDCVIDEKGEVIVKSWNK